MKLRTVKGTYTGTPGRYEYTLNEHGQMHGTYRGWYHNGQLMEQSEYVNDKRRGISLQWHGFGQLWKVKFFDVHGQLLLSTSDCAEPHVTIKIAPSDNIELAGVLANLVSALQDDNKTVHMIHITNPLDFNRSITK